MSRAALVDLVATLPRWGPGNCWIQPFVVRVSGYSARASADQEGGV